MANKITKKYSITDYGLVYKVLICMLAFTNILQVTFKNEV